MVLTRASRSLAEKGFRCGTCGGPATIYGARAYDAFCEFAAADENGAGRSSP
jgi:hypothetical protein